MPNSSRVGKDQERAIVNHAKANGFPGADQRDWIIELPYKRPPLSLNDRGQSVGARKRKAALIQQVRADVKTLARAAQIPALPAIHVRLNYQPYDNRRRDSDNLVATLKPCIDGLVDAGIVPDDCTPYVDWSRPFIHPAAPGRAERLWLVVAAINEMELTP